MKMKYASLFILLITTLIPGIILGVNYSNCYYSEKIKIIEGFGSITTNAHMNVVQDTKCRLPNAFCNAIVYCDEGATIVTCQAIQVGKKLNCPSASDCINATDKISVDAGNSGQQQTDEEEE